GIKGYDYKNIRTKAQLNAGIIDVSTHIDDVNLALSVDGRVGIVPAKEYYQLNVDLKGMDLFRLGLHDKHIQVSAKVNTDIKGSNVKSMNGYAAIRDIVIVKDNKEYKIDSLMVAAVNEPSRISTTVTSALLTAQFNGNIDLLSVAPVVSSHLDRYFKMGDSSKVKPSQQAQQNFDFVVKVNPSPIIKEVFLPELNTYTPLEIKGGFNSVEAKLWMDLSLAQASYGNQSIQDLKFNFNTGRDTARYALNLREFSSGDIKLFKTELAGDIAHNKAFINLSVDDSLGADQLSLQSILTKAGDHFRFKLLPQGLKIKKEEWVVNESNLMEFGSKYLKVDQFKISNNGQSIALQSSQDLKDLKVAIDHFELRTLSQIIEKNDSVLRGTLNGQVDLQDFQKDLHFTSNLMLTNLVYKSSKVGDISIKADNLTAQRYSVHAVVSGMGNDIDLSGYYSTADKSNALNFTLDVKTLKLASFESFSNKQISQSSGDVVGKLQISGNADQPLIAGRLTFKEAKTKVAVINQTLYMKEESIEFSQNGISFMAFTVRDELGNTAKINGDVLMKAFKDIKFQMDISMRDFMVMNTSAIQNKSYYGKLVLDSDVRVRGTPSLPVIDATVNISKGSKFTVAVPESKVSVDKGEGVVVFLYDPSDLH
ncbi:MAG TPA: translocation/assembly module TamB domain-containing protein, partial [Cytophagales bacterium]|nr:translocation/assembly module TamB domain-containing protein [Cytophagales bacterium]